MKKITTIISIKAFSNEPLRGNPQKGPFKNIPRKIPAIHAKFPPRDLRTRLRGSPESAEINFNKSEWKIIGASLGIGREGPRARGFWDRTDPRQWGADSIAAQ